MRVPVGPIASIPADECISVADGRAVVVRVGTEIRAYRNRCLHQDAPLAGGWVRNGVLSCPLHFWRYDVSTGHLRGTGIGCLDRFEVEYDDRDAFVVVPDDPPQRSLRDELRERARSYDREREFEARQGTDRS